MSNINPYNIDGTFPIADQNNNSQGFRTNFTNTQNNFVYAASELADLQAKAITISPLSVNGAALNNNMAGTQLTGPQLTSYTSSLINLGAVNDTLTLDFDNGNFQMCVPSTSLVLGFHNWPQLAGTGAPIGYATMRVWFVIENVAITITLPDSVSVGQIDIAGFNASSGTITFDNIGVYVFDFSSVDGGSNFLISDVTRNRSTFKDPNFYFNPIINSTMLVGFGEGFAVGEELAQGQDIISACGSVNSVSIGNLSLANVGSLSTDDGTLAGFTITSTNGNILTGVIEPVQSNDILGYVGVNTFTGNGSSNVITQVSSIDFFATGSNVVNGLGGNIAFFTAGDGLSGALRQALSITNNQTVEVIGALQTDSAIIELGTLYSEQPGSGFTAILGNNYVSTYIIDSASTTIAHANVVLPPYPTNMQTLHISSTVPITTANVSAGSVPVKGVPVTVFGSAAGSVKLTYIGQIGAWVRS